MSAPQTKITDAKSKSKFQSLNINNLYQGAPNRPTSKGLPAKHGLQSLGKVPTARRAPANLPSVKSEKGGNDPSVVLVPSGAGWASKEGEGGLERGQQEQPAQPKEQEKPAASKPSGPKSWSSVTGNAAPAAARPDPQPTQQRQRGFLHQKSPLFGQEFPSLAAGEIAPAGSPGARETTPEIAGREGGEMGNGQGSPAEYGPGPSLRPQTFGNWGAGGQAGGRGGGPGTPGEGEAAGLQPPQPHKPQPPAQVGPGRSPPSTSQYRSIMPPFMDAMELPSGPPPNFDSRRRSAGREGREGRGPRHTQARGRPGSTTEFMAHSVIDREKLKRMDDLDAGDDWLAYEDDDFDYNKKLQSDDDEPAESGQASSPAAPAATADPNWADAVGGAQHSTVQPSYGFYEQEVGRKAGPAYSGPADEEERRRSRKSEEVMKNIERARQRREEEEARYRGGGSGGGRGAGRGGPHYTDHRTDSDPGRYRGERGGYRGGHRDWEAGQPFDNGEQEDKRRGERKYPEPERSPLLAPGQELSGLEEGKTGGSPDWADRGLHSIQDWVEDVEEGEKGVVSAAYREESRPEHDPPSRPGSRDSRVSKESRGSKESKGSRASRDRDLGLAPKKEEKYKFEKEAGKAHPEEVEKKNGRGGKHQHQQPAVQDIRGYFRDGVQEQHEKKQFRHAPGPITREKLDSMESGPPANMTNLTQLKKRDSGKVEEKPDEKEVRVEPLNIISSLLDPDLLENISEDDDILGDDEEEKEVAAAVTNRGRGGRGGRGRGDSRQQQNFSEQQRGGRVGKGERGGRGGRGGRQEKQRGGSGGNKWGEVETEEDGDKKQSGTAGWGFLPRGQPSRRGRGEGRGARPAAAPGRSQAQRQPQDEQADEFGAEWGASARAGKERKGGAGRPGSGAGEELEEWETASETSLEERDKKAAKSSGREPGAGRGGRGRGRGTTAPGSHWDGAPGAGKPRRGGHVNSGGSGGTALTEVGTEAAEVPYKKAGGENFELADYAAVHPAEDSQWSGELEPNTEFGVEVGKKSRGGMGGAGRGRPGERADYRRPPPETFDKKLNKTAYDRRQSKLPPRLAKQREVVRAAARGSGSPGTENGWPDGDKMGVFSVEPDIGTGAWEKPLESGLGQVGGATENGGGIQQTMVFENTAYKGGKSDKLDKAGPIQLPLSFGKPEADTADLKLDFTFGPEDGMKPGAGPPPTLSIPRSLTAGLPASPSTDDLQTKLANTKKLWDQPGMPVVPENSSTGGSWQEDWAGGEAGESGQDKAGDGTGSGQPQHTVAGSNVAKVKPQQQLNMGEGERGVGGGGASHLQYSRMAVPSPPGSLPPSQLAPMQPWAFLPDPASRTSPMYNPYSQLNQSILMPGVTGHNINTQDLFNSNTGGYRGQVQGVPTFPGSAGHTTTNNVLMSQASLINSQVKLGSGIGPIGTKAGAGAGPGPSSPYLANLPNTNSNIFIQYDNSGNPLNYLPGSAPPGRGNTPSQTAFYQSLAAASRQQQAFNALQGFNAANALSQQQLRASAVAGIPFMKSEQAKSPVSLSDSAAFTGSVPPYNGRAGNQAGPPSPKTKLKMAQQQEQAKLTANMNNMNLNNLNALAQMQRTMGLGQYNHLGGLVQPAPVPGQYNPSPIARPQVSLHQGAGLPGGQMNKQMNQYFNQEDSDKYEGGEESGAAVEKAPEAEEGGEEVELAVSAQEAAPAAAPVVEQEASLAN